MKYKFSTKINTFKKGLLTSVVGSVALLGGSAFGASATYSVPTALTAPNVMADNEVVNVNAVGVVTTDGLTDEPTLQITGDNTIVNVASTAILTTANAGVASHTIDVNPGGNNHNITINNNGFIAANSQNTIDLADVNNAGMTVNINNNGAIIGPISNTPGAGQGIINITMGNGSGSTPSLDAALNLSNAVVDSDFNVFDNFSTAATIDGPFVYVIGDGTNLATFTVAHNVGGGTAARNVTVDANSTLAISANTFTQDNANTLQVNANGTASISGTGAFVGGNVTNAGTMNLSTDSATVINANGVLTNTGTINLSGALGILDFNGAVNNNNGGVISISSTARLLTNAAATFANGSTLNISGTGGAGNVAVTATNAGSSWDGIVNFTNTGKYDAAGQVVAVGATGKVTVSANDALIDANNITFAVGSSLEFTSDANNDLPQVTLDTAAGAVNLANATIVVNEGTNTAAPSTRTIFFNANNQAVNAANATVSSGSKFYTYALQTTQTNVANDTLQVVLTKKSLDTVVDIPSEQFASFSTALNSVEDTSAEVRAVTSELKGLVDHQIADGLEQLNEGVSLNPGAHSAAVMGSTRVTGLGFARLAELRGTQTSYTAGSHEGYGVWMKGFGGTTRQKRRKNVEGYNTDTVGFSLGADYDINDRITAGLGVGYAYTRAKSRLSTQSTVDVKSIQGMLYGSYNFNKGYYVDAALNYGNNDYERDRKISFGNIEQTYAAEHKGNQIALRVDGGYDMHWKKCNVTPKLGLSYVHSKQNAYTESTNIRQDTALMVDSSSVDMLQGRLGVEVGKSYEHPAGGKYTPSLELAVLHDFIGDKATSMNQFRAANSPSFEVKGVKPVQTSMLIGLGFKYEGDNKELGLSYDYEFKNDYLAHAGYATFRYKF